MGNKTRAFGLFLLAILASGLPMWFNSNHEHENDATLTLAIPLLLTLLSRITTKLRSRTICFAVAAGAWIAMVIKIFIDLHYNPTSHNLFPFEVVIDGILISLAALAGIAIGTIIERLRNWCKKGFHSKHQ